MIGPVIVQILVVVLGISLLVGIRPVAPVPLPATVLASSGMAVRIGAGSHVRIGGGAAVRKGSRLCASMSGCSKKNSCDGDHPPGGKALCFRYGCCWIEGNIVR